MGIKWFFALNDAGSSFANYAVMSQVAVLSARRHTSLEPHFLFDGAPCALTQWMQQQGVRVIHHRTSVYERLQQHALETGKKNTLMTGAGAFLRLDIPDVCAQHGIDDRLVLYTDCDVLFRRDIERELRALNPRYFAAAPQFHQHDPSDMNSGVLWMNLENLRPMQERFRNFIRENLDALRLTGFDQAALRAFYGRRRWGGPAWDALPLTLNWKPHWGRNEAAGILHFHGPKPTQRSQLACGTAPSALVPLASPDYYAYCRQWDEFALGLGGPGVQRPASSKLAAFPAVIAGFDEAGYAAANFDVALAVQGGYYSNGLEHYLTAGFWENRSGVAEPVMQAARRRLSPIEAEVRALGQAVAPPRAARVAGRILASLATAAQAEISSTRRQGRDRTLVLGDEEVARYLACLSTHPVTSAQQPWSVVAGAVSGASAAPIAQLTGRFERTVLVLNGGVTAGWESSDWMREIARVTRPGGIIVACFDLRQTPSIGRNTPAAKRASPLVRRNHWFEVLARQTGVGAGLVVMRRRAPAKSPARPG